MAPHPPRRSRAPRRRAAARPPHRAGVVPVVLAAALALVLAGCTLRLESEPPAPLVPDVAEVARQGTTADAVALVALAEVAAPDAPAGAADVLVAVADVSEQHVEALGGLYGAGPSPAPTDADGAQDGEPGTTAADDAVTVADAVRAQALAAPTPARSPGGAPAGGATPGGPSSGGASPRGATPDATTSADPAPPAAAGAAPADVVALLDESAASARAHAAEVTDAGLARLLASVAASRLLLADRLAAAADVDRVRAQPFRVPDRVPAGLPADLVATLVQSEDATGMAWEVLAARRSDGARRVAAARAEAHRDRAADWARAAEVAGTGLDPRRAAYALPDALLDPSDAGAAGQAVRELERGLAATYAAAVGDLAPANRGVVVDGLLDSARAGWPGQVPAFPGMPDLDRG